MASFDGLSAGCYFRAGSSANLFRVTSGIYGMESKLKP
jgi:hypothetical protein